LKSGLRSSARALWNECAKPVAEFGAEVPLFGGLDLSEVNDLTALVLVGKVEGVWHVKPTFWLPEEGLYERARKDRVPYDEWHRQGFLATVPGASVSYEYIAEWLYEAFRSSTTWSNLHSIGGTGGTLSRGWKESGSRKKHWPKGLLNSGKAFSPCHQR
jgi:hypothetical protein